MAYSNARLEKHADTVEGIVAVGVLLSTVSWAGACAIVGKAVGGDAGVVIGLTLGGALGFGSAYLAAALTRLVVEACRAAGVAAFAAQAAAVAIRKVQAQGGMQSNADRKAQPNSSGNAAFCVECGSSVTGGAAFCDACGTQQ